MTNLKKIEWILRIGVAGEFLGHGVFALMGRADWRGWIVELVGVSDETAGTLLMLVGVSDVVVALWVLYKPVSPVLLWAAFWGFFTALVRPLVGSLDTFWSKDIWDFIERFANWAAPLALYYLNKRE